MKNGIPKTAQTGVLGTLAFKVCSGKPWVFIFIVVVCLFVFHDPEFEENQTRFQ